MAKQYKTNTMIWSISWKNVWRNKKRSLTVIIAVTLGVVAGVFTAGLMKGWTDQRVNSAIYTEVSHLKIRNPKYLLNEEIKYTVPDQAAITRKLENDPDVAAFSERIKIMAMAATSRGNTAVMLEGINLQAEKKVSNVYEKIVPDGGTFFKEEMRNPIVISDKTAEQLRIKNYEISDQVIDSLKTMSLPGNVIDKLMNIKNERYKTQKLFEKSLQNILSKKEINKYGRNILNLSMHYRLHSKIVFTFTGPSGQMIYQTFRVCGIYKTSNTMFDQIHAYVLKDELAAITDFSNTDCHEIGVILNNEIEPRQYRDKFRSEFPALSVMSWEDLAPDASLSEEFMGIYYYVIMGIILFALAFGIINTMLMAILERTKELGMLMAIGMNKKRVFNMIMLETIFLTLVGAVVGMLSGALIIAITKHTGLNFSAVAEGFEAMGWSAIVYPDINTTFFLGVTLLVIITGILASILPARKALKLKPVEAIRTE